MNLVRFFLAWMLVFAIPQVALANGLTPPVFGGHFATPAEPDPAGTYWNPGALGFVKGTQGFVNVSPTYFPATYTPSFTPTTVSSTLFQVTPLIAVTSDFGLENLTCAISVYAPFGGTTNWPADGPQRYNGAKSTIMTVNAGPVVSYKVLPSLSVGAGAFYVYNSLEANMSLDMYPDLAALGLTSPAWTKSTGCESPETEGCEARIDLSNATGNSWEWAAGVFFAPTEDMSFGLSYQSPIDVTLKGDIRVFSVNPKFNTFLNVNETGAKAKVTVDYVLPQTVNFGGRIRLTNNWQADLMIRWLNWDVHDKLDIHISGDKGPAKMIVNGDRDILRGYADAFSGRLGGIYSGFTSWRLFGALGYDQSGVKDEYMSASNMEFDKIYLAAALEYTMLENKLRLGAGFKHDFIIPRTITNSKLPQSGNGKYDGYWETFDFTVAYIF